MTNLKNTSEVYITDKTGDKFFKTLCSTQYSSSEVHNMNCHINQAKQYPDHYKFLDIATAVVKCDAYGEQDEPLDFDMSDDELLELLGV